MHTTRLKRPLQLLAATSALTVALTGCSSSDGSADKGGGAAGAGNADAGTSEQVQDFARIVPEPTKGAITIKVSDPLKQAMGAEASGLLVDSISAKARPLEGAQYCAVDLTFGYVNDGASVLGQPEFTQAMADEKAAAQVAELRRQAKEVSPEKQKLVLADPQWFYYTLEGVELLSADADALKAKYPSGYTGAWEQLAAEAEPFIKAARKAEADESAKVPVWERAGRYLSRTSPDLGMSALDPKDPKPGVYLSEDLKTATQVKKCALSPTQPTEERELYFPVKSAKKIDKLATVEFNVMKDGTISLALAGVEGYAVDQAGNWIKQ